MDSKSRTESPKPSVVSLFLLFLCTVFEGACVRAPQTSFTPTYRFPVRRPPSPPSKAGLPAAGLQQSRAFSSGIGSCRLRVGQDGEAVEEAASGLPGSQPGL